MERLRADADWLAGPGIQLSQCRPDPDSGKVRVYLAHFTKGARQLLEERYGSAIVVATESRRWGSMGSTG
jgi:hypothetical protein